MKFALLMALMLVGTTGFAQRKNGPQRNPSQAAIVSGQVEIVPLINADGSTGVGALNITGDAAKSIYEAMSAVKEEADGGDRQNKRVVTKEGTKIACFRYEGRDGSIDYRCETGPVNAQGGFEDHVD